MKPFWIVILTAIIAGGLAGGGTYYYVKNQSNSDKKALQSQIDTLNVTVTALQKSATGTASTSSSAATTLPDNWLAETNKVVLNYLNLSFDNNGSGNADDQALLTSSFKNYINCVNDWQKANESKYPIGLCNCDPIFGGFQDYPQSYKIVETTKDNNKVAAKVDMGSDDPTLKYLTFSTVYQNGQWLIDSTSGYERIVSSNKEVTCVKK